MDTMIQTKNLTRVFGAMRAVDDLSFEVRRGEVLGFLGPNGAGKSTTMKMITGFLTPSSGNVLVDNLDVEEHAVEVKKRIGYLPENAPLYPEMTVYDFLMFIGEVRSMKTALLKTRLEEVVESTSLSEVLHQRIETLSKGFRRRVGLAQAILHDPAVLILDEPTDGLDPNQKYEVRKLITSMSKDKCIVVSTHILEEVDAICSRAIIIAHGKIVADGTPAELKVRSAGSGNIVLDFERSEDAKTACDVLSGDSDFGSYVLESGRVLIEAKKSKVEVYDFVLRTLRENSVLPLDIRSDTGQLDEVFRAVTR